MPTITFIAILVSLYIWIFMADRGAQEAYTAFHNRCDAQHGVVLASKQRDGDNWLGCYTGVKELYNEG